MTVSYTTTATLGAVTADDLGGWGSDFLLFAAHTEADAVSFGGYDPAATSPRHFLLLWRGCGVPGLVLRYLHYFEPSSGLSGGEQAAAGRERAGLEALDGTRTAAHACTVPGMAAIEYF
jgi:hypothetical protein